MKLFKDETHKTLQAMNITFQQKDLFQFLSSNSFHEKRK